ncbi:MAG: hypothetical protein JW870_19115 [Candidatus Delongbacteria bacterium]|nr:hypothetical protein [Candidatus Delongbacteria bacterium]
MELMIMSRSIDLENYDEEIKNIALQINKAKVEVFDYINSLVEENDAIFDELKRIRKECTIAEELENNKGYLELGYFNSLDEVERIVCFLISFEIKSIININNIYTRFKEYSEEHIIFKQEPKLWKYVRNNDAKKSNKELIDASVFEQIDNSEIVRFNNSFMIIEKSLNPSILVWTKLIFSGSPLYIRINPNEIYKHMPPRDLFEAISMPADPEWWKKLKLHKNKKTGASYFLQDCSPKINVNQYIDYHVNQIRRLEITTTRNNSGNLSMMIEELTCKGSSGVMIGRMIHLDTDDKYGTDFNDSHLNHLDLAVNIYENERVQKRIVDRLETGNKTVKASKRTHLMRIEKIPFIGLLGFAYAFFKSKTLLNEWYMDQFGFNIKEE